MPFEPTNAHPFYTAMMKDLQDEWDQLFIIKVQAMKTYDNKEVSLFDQSRIKIADKTLVWGSKIIIDESNPP